MGKLNIWCLVKWIWSLDDGFEVGCGDFVDLEGKNVFFECLGCQGSSKRWWKREEVKYIEGMRIRARKPRNILM